MKAVFLKSANGIGYGYFKDDVADLSNEVFSDLEKRGYVRAFIPDDYVAEGTPLPDDFPGRAKLIENGFEFIEDMQKIGDVTEIKGIGTKLAKQIESYLLNY